MFVLKRLSIIYDFFIKRVWNIFLHCTYCAVEVVYVMVSSIVVEIVFCDILRMICYIDFKCSSINFHKQRKEPARYQYLCIGHLTFKTYIHDNGTVEFNLNLIWIFMWYQINQINFSKFSLIAILATLRFKFS